MPTKIAVVTINLRGIVVSGVVSVVDVVGVMVEDVDGVMVEEVVVGRS